MNSSFPNRWSFSYLKFTEYVTNIIADNSIIVYTYIDGSLRKALAENRTNSSFPNRWSFSYLKVTKYVANRIAEPKCKYGQQEQVTEGTTTEVPPWNGRYTNTGGLKPVLRDPNLALSFCYMTRIMGTKM